MEANISVKVDNTNEIRYENNIQIDKDIPDEHLAEILEDAIQNYSQKDFNWYDNNIRTTLNFGSLKIEAEVSYSFSSEVLCLKAYKDKELIKNKNYENNQVDIEWEPEETTFDFMSAINREIVASINSQLEVDYQQEEENHVYCIQINIEEDHELSVEKHENIYKFEIHKDINNEWSFIGNCGGFKGANHTSSGLKEELLMFLPDSEHKKVMLKDGECEQYINIEKELSNIARRTDIENATDYIKNNFYNKQEKDLQ